MILENVVTKYQFFLAPVFDIIKYNFKHRSKLNSEFLHITMRSGAYFWNITQIITSRICFKKSLIISYMSPLYINPLSDLPGASIWNDLIVTTT